MLSKWVSLNIWAPINAYTYICNPPSSKKKKTTNTNNLALETNAWNVRHNWEQHKEIQSTPFTQKTPSDTKSTKAYLFDRPFSFKELKVSFNHLKLNITLLTKRKALKFFLITIYNSFCIKFQPKCQVLLSNLLKGCNSAVSRIKDKRSELAFMGKPSWRWDLPSSPHKNINV